MSGRSARHHVQTYVHQDLYEQILREAAVQRQTVSECIRAALQEIYAIREEMSRPFEREYGEGSPAARLGHQVLGQFEERMVGGFSRQIDEIQAVREQLQRLEGMVDRQYVGLMLQLPDVGADEEQKRSASASRRYHAWRRAVEKLLGSSRRSPQDALDWCLRSAWSPADGQSSAGARSAAPRRNRIRLRTTRQSVDHSKKGVQDQRLGANPISLILL